MNIKASIVNFLLNLLIDFIYLCFTLMNGKQQV